MKDVERGYTDGPFTEDQVSQRLGTDKWRRTPRHPIKQKGKIREIDACNLSKINELVGCSEKMRLPSTNFTMITARKLKSKYRAKHGRRPRVSAVVFDESKAYRQIGIAPEHLKYSVIVVKNPQGGVVFFIMNSFIVCSLSWKIACFSVDFSIMTTISERMIEHTRKLTTIITTTNTRSSQ